ncbi:hypothetical protein M5X17_31180 [Paenibacillus alvei]|uniref:hypothetical protein n=1 Tax=Paenibacillus alvei TaxID=44250 RepID=UPI00227F8B67|nr:hypothetical protein [Paenibacillus alvei]MCY9738157.1 hypothetical protein [Paenibacillus alvei]
MIKMVMKTPQGVVEKDFTPISTEPMISEYVQFAVKHNAYSFRALKDGKEIMIMDIGSSEAKRNVRHYGRE